MKLVVLAGVVMILAGCTLPDTPDIAADKGTVSVTIVTAGGASHVVLACPPDSAALLPPPGPPGRRTPGK